MKRRLSLLSTTDLRIDEIRKIFRLATKFKHHPYSNLLKRRSLGMIFQQSSTRTRVSFEVAMTQLGGHALNLNQNDLKLSTGETISDTARVLSRYVDIISARIFLHKDLEELVRNSTIPVINAMTNDYHPCQALADVFTILEKKKRLRGLKVAFVGDGDNNVTNSLLILCAQLGINFFLASPKQHMITQEMYSVANKLARKSSALISIGINPKIAVKDADVVATDIWTSPGKSDIKARMRIFPPYQVNRSLLKIAKKDAIVLHCLPAQRGNEITNEVIVGPQSAVWDEAENRLHIQKAVLAYLLA